MRRAQVEGAFAAVVRRGAEEAGAVFIIPATLTHNPLLSVLFTCVAFFGIEVTVGVSWAIPLDIAGDHAGCDSHGDRKIAK